MGIYAITGASSGIGAKTKELLEADGNRVINIDLKGGDICVNLASEAGRQKAIDELHRLCPDGLDGMICNAGVSGAKQYLYGHPCDTYRVWQCHRRPGCGKRNRFFLLWCPTEKYGGARKECIEFMAAYQ